MRTGNTTAAAARTAAANKMPSAGLGGSNEGGVGGFTRKVYALIRDHRYLETVKFLQDKLISYPTNRAALSLLGFCHFQLQEFGLAADAYERIVEFYPELEQYKLHYAQCLFKSGLTTEATKVLTGVKSEKCGQQVVKLKAAIRFAEEDLAGAQQILAEVKQEDIQTQINSAVMLIQDEKYGQALDRLLQSHRRSPWDGHIVYNIALCYYRLNEFKECAKYCNDIISHEVKLHPEFLVGVVTDGVADFQTVSNTFALQKSALVEAFNLKAAMDFRVGKMAEARISLTDLPPRKEEEIDAVTLHNQAIMNMDDHPEDGFEKLHFLISTAVFPPETFPNLIILYLKYDHIHQAADVIAENPDLARRYLETYLKNLFEAKLLLENNPKESFRMMESILTSEGEAMRSITRRLREAQKNHDEAAKQRIIHEFDAALERYVPVLMAQAKIYWDKNNFKSAEKLLSQGREFCEDSDTWRLNESWRLNVGHVLFMQKRYDLAIRWYEMLVKRHLGDLLSLSAVVLGNLCVCYIMESKNKDGEVLMAKIGEAEEKAEGYGSQSPIFHLAVVNLVIGTLYCSSKNYQFGMDRIVKTFDNCKKKLGTATWTYAKRCVLSLLESMANHMITKGSMGVYSDKFMNEMLQFLEIIEFHGKEVAAWGYSDFDGNLVGDENDDEVDYMDDNDATDGEEAKKGSIATTFSEAMPNRGLDLESSKPQGKNTVAYEARLLKALFLDLTNKYTNQDTKL